MVPRVRAIYQAGPSGHPVRERCGSPFFSNHMTKLDLLYFDAGGGHRAAVNALRQVTEQKGRPFDLRLVNAQEVLDPIDVFRKLTGVRLQDYYNLILKKGWTLGSPQLKTGMQLVIRLFHTRQVEGFARFWRGSRPDMVVSLIPHLNRA